MVPIALYTGMRQNEIAQLHLSDIITDHDTGITYFRVHDEGDRTIKSDAGIRNVPIHDKLLKAGLMQFVKARTKEQYLFPELWQYEDGTPTTESQSNRVNKRFNGDNKKTGYFEKCGITEAKKVFHSIRHTVVSTLRKNRVDSYYIARIVGHDKDLGITGHYGIGELEDIKRDIDKIDYGEFGSLDHISFTTYEKRKPRLIKKTPPRTRRGNRARLKPQLN
jgi:integrase